ncbi:DUF1045 domain-containing protein [Candidatus Saccharibacteria bacterium]|nr:DUF1045 domain-containing protein [Candidatus Saccharibacteria bacterium]
MEPSISDLQTIPCDIVLLPSDEQAQLAIQASQLLSSQGSLFTLDNLNFYAHASLYMFQMDINNQNDCISVLQQIALKTHVQKLAQAGYVYQDSGFGKGYVDAAFARNEEADLIQELVVDKFNSLRAGMRESDKNKIADATGLKLENLQKYGYPAVGELFRPHITLTRFPMDVEPNLAVLPSSEIFSGDFTRIGLFEMGTNGTCIRKIAEFDLGAY